jgi:hypothetical protein
MGSEELAAPLHSLLLNNRPSRDIYQGFSHFERGHVKSERGHLLEAFLKRSLAFFMRSPHRLAETLMISFRLHSVQANTPS